VDGVRVGQRPEFVIGTDTDSRTDCAHRRVGAAHGKDAGGIGAVRRCEDLTDVNLR
jgi:hypothetical protein